VRLAEFLFPRYLYYHFLKDARTGRFARSSKGVGIHHLGAERLATLPVALPPLTEQHQIVAELESHLSTIDYLDQTIDQALAQAAALRQAILKKAFSGRLVPQDPEDEPASVLLERVRTDSKL
jgi:type I restriction enzyme S subunit